MAGKWSGPKSFERSPKLSNGLVQVLTNTKLGYVKYMQTTIYTTRCGNKKEVRVGGD